MHLVLFAILKIIIVIFWEKFIGMPCAGSNGLCHPPPTPLQRGTLLAVRRLSFITYHCISGL